MDDQPKMETKTYAKELDIVIVVDSTGSMDPFLIALTRFLPQLLAIRALTTSPSTSGVSDILSPLQTDQRFKRIRKIGILTYKDYYPVPTHLYPNQIGSIVHPIPANDQAAAALQPKMKIEDVLAWSGWDDPQLVDSNRDGKERSTGLESQYLSEWVKGIAAEGGGDYPEAAKSALRRLLDIVVAESTQAAVETVVLWYTDAPPHHRCHRGINRVLEIGAHGCTPTERGWDCQSDGPSQSSAAPASNRNEDKSRPPQQLPPTISMQPYISKMNFPGPAPSTVPASRCIDWIYMTRQSKDAGLRVYTILPPSMPDMDASFYAVLGATTGGGVFVVGGKESKKDKGKEKEKEKTKEEDGDGSGWYNELMISGGAPFVKAITALSLEIVLALVGLEDPGSRITDPNEDTQMEDDAVSAKMEISEPPKTGRGGFRGVRSDRRRRGYWSRGHYYPPRGRRHRPGNRPFTLRDTSEDELELEEMLQEELTGKDMPIQWLSYEEDVVSYMNGRPAPEKEPETTTKAEEPLEPTPEKAQQQEQPDTQPSAPTEPAAEAQTQVAPRLIRIDDEENALGFLPYPWRGPTQPGAWLKKILRENVEGVELTKRIVRHGEEETTKDENEKGKSNEGGSAQMETSVYAEANETPSEAITFLLKRIVDMDVEAIPRVWLFAGIWRSIGKQSSNNLQQSLFALFSDRVDNIKKEDLRKRLKDWAAINHDASAEITQLLGKTTIAEQENLVLSLDDDAAGQSGLRKEDALDLTKTCDKKLLKKMGYLLRYTKAVPASAAVDNRHQIVLSTTTPETVFRVLPHLAFEGVMYTPRTAAILAIVAITSHIPHLVKPAQLLLETTKGSWLNALTPENFSPVFARFIVSLPSTSRDAMLSSEESNAYEGMAKYTVLEENLDTKLQGMVPWTPMKTRGVGDRKRVCEGCGTRRSETMMHQVGSQVKKRKYVGLEGKKEDVMEDVDGMRCGMCVDSDTKNPQDWKDQGDIQSCWVECSERWCRANYVIEDEEGLRIPPRCYYCRKRRPCPWIECTKCGNRIILPKSYRVNPADSPSNFTCPPCQNQSYTGHKTIVHKLTTLRSILFANDYEVEWLGVKPFKEIFRGRSTFMIWEIYGGDIFGAVTPSSSPLGTPPTSSPPISPGSGSEKRDKGGKDKKKRLELYGKRLLNPSDLREELNGIVHRTLRKDRVLCGLTYEFVRPEELVKACDDVRKVEDGGCAFYASVEGLREWYSGDGERRKQCPACRGPGRAV